MNLILQPRDRKILDALNRYGVLSTNQIQELFFKSTSHTTMMRRLRLLKNANWIRNGASLTNAENTFCLGFRANALYPERESNHFTNRSTIFHDVLLSSLRMRLEDFGLAKVWTPEFEIRAKALRNQWRGRDEIVIPDGLWIESIQNEFKAIAVELELTIKSRSRYKQIFNRHFLTNDHVYRFFYIVRTTKDMIRIYEAAKESPGFQLGWLWFSSIDSILNDADPRLLSCATGKWLKFSEVGFNEFKQMPKPDKLGNLPAQGVSRQSLIQTAPEQKGQVIEMQKESLLKTG